jgi:hypothetical protein
MAGVPAPSVHVASPIEPFPTSAERETAAEELWEPSGIIINLILAGVVLLGAVAIGGGMLIMIAETVLGHAR